MMIGPCDNETPHDRAVDRENTTLNHTQNLSMMRSSTLVTSLFVVLGFLLISQVGAQDIIQSKDGTITFTCPSTSGPLPPISFYAKRSKS